jgi:hypothetical protein
MMRKNESESVEAKSQKRLQEMEALVIFTQRVGEKNPFS